ncbi:MULTISPECIES: flagellar filament capping protein FliD [unclassified Serratia (in: enterobacteria)]|uniref:flagellar filament capping protein FliD n=1 Tax=unclassified Serratia (in: enterobacteria) TaxID=2647522 RepID=UPI000504E5EE|nr:MULTISPECIES: flagellar filament capping protein FliD [unclassified Serratia (in: enterobacteria)]KFK95336.1 flagellar hook-associated protein [Serratia sp. Ag2]KFK98684.1 flagellar hook-associated protein [Serratia sp. Ag1]
MSDLTSLDPQTLASQLASYDVLSMKTALQKQTLNLKAQQTALNTLRTSLNDFRTALTALNKTDNGMLQNSATTSTDGVATVTASSTAQKGTYNLFVKQLASAHQVSYDNLNDDAIKNATGTMSITINGKSVDVEMDGLNSMADFAGAVNSSKENPGVTVSLIRTDGNVSMMFSSDETGAANQVSLDTSKMDGTSAGLFDTANQDTISKAADAIFRLGDSPKEYTSSSNTLDKLIDGVKIELTQAQKEGETPLRIQVGTDTSSTKEQVQSFVDAFNALKSSLDTLTASGSGGKERGAFAGDSAIASLERELNAMLRTEFGEKSITQYGITADREGKLKIDSSKLDKALTDDPNGLNALFNGNDGLLKKVDQSLDKYLNSSTGMLKGRQETLDRQQAEVDGRTDKISARYETSYNRYLRQFTQLQSVMTQMNNTMSMFGLV